MANIDAKQGQGRTDCSNCIAFSMQDILVIDGYAIFHGPDRNEVVNSAEFQDCLIALGGNLEEQRQGAADDRQSCIMNCGN